MSKYRNTLVLSIEEAKNLLVEDRVKMFLADPDFLKENIEQGTLDLFNLKVISLRTLVETLQDLNLGEHVAITKAVEVVLVEVEPEKYWSIWDYFTLDENERSAYLIKQRKETTKCA